MQQTNPVPFQTQGERLDRTVSGLAANPRLDSSGSEMGTHVRTVYNNDVSMGRPPPGFQTGFDQEVAHGDSSRDIDEICDENIQLFRRCEQYVQMENELKTTVVDLENQVAETKRICAELLLRLELLRRQKLVR